MGSSARSIIGLLITGILLAQLSFVQACTYTSISTALNTCTSVASGTSNTRWMFPYGTTAQQATFCQSDVQTNLSICVQSAIWPCMSQTKVTKTFGTNGTNLITAYTNLCANSLINDAQACMSVVTPISTYTSAESSYVSAIDALPTAATDIEICGLILTLKYPAYITLLTPTCTTASHLAVWTSFFDTIINTYACASFTGSANTFNQSASIWLPIVLTFLVRLVKF